MAKSLVRWPSPNKATKRENSRVMLNAVQAKGATVAAKGSSKGGGKLP